LDLDKKWKRKRKKKSGNWRL